MKGATLALALTGCGASVGAGTVPPVEGIPVEPAPGSVPVPVPAPGSASASVPAPALANGCPEDMVPVGAFCVDRYEAPNQKGELPLALRTAYDGEDWCAARGKRLCTEDEWTRACAGPHGRVYPYGDAYRESACNDDHEWFGVAWKKLARWPLDVALDEATRLYQADMSGARAECVTEEGVYDMAGNVAEWARRSSTPSKPGYEHVLKGCYWAGCFKDPRASCRFTNGVHPGTFRTYEAGFRCCKARATGVASPP